MHMLVVQKKFAHFSHYFMGRCRYSVNVDNSVSYKLYYNNIQLYA